MSENIIEKNAVEQYEHDYVVYAKEGEQIGDLLSLMEAPKARMNFEFLTFGRHFRSQAQWYQGIFPRFQSLRKHSTYS